MPETTVVGVPPRFCLLQAGQRIVQGHPDPLIWGMALAQETSKAQHDIACWFWGVVFLLPARDCMNSPAKVSFLVLEMTCPSSKCGEFLDHAAETVVDSWEQGSKVVLAAGYRFQSTTSRVWGFPNPMGEPQSHPTVAIYQWQNQRFGVHYPYFRKPLVISYQWQNQ